ncbi:hypothetical protein HU200_042943 [Digitaria exilis]|uniref:Uncharacterized protein n=1 Tax=Digitaria exilis TaxID=1010633 RepID=A0A835B6G6_9POAL|nr:hypothetical protein HU200_042943 [Digitaria exilis]CAB3471089.1 unnamed protein product [Digitaria exilis]
MAASFFSAFCRILVVAMLIVATLSSYGASARFVCRGKCEDFPDCDNWCRTAGGYPKGGQCVPPFDQYCCCIE